MSAFLQSTPPLFISLGARCGVTWQLRNRFADLPTLPFDWLVTPLQSIQPMIEENFSALVDKKYLETAIYFKPLTRQPRQTIFNTRYNIFLHHDFPRRDPEHLADDWMEKIADVKNKYAYLAERFSEIANQNVVFVRSHGRFSMPDETPLPTTQSDYENLLAFFQKTNPAARLAVADADCAIDHPNIITQNIGVGDASDWSNPDEYWKGPPKKWSPFITRILKHAA